MGATERIVDRATRRATQLVRSIGSELREARLAAGLSQERVAAAAHVSRPWYARLEAGRIRSPGFVELARVAAVLGLDLSARLYPGPSPLRDAGQSAKLSLLLAPLAGPLRARREVPLPAREGVPEQRSWDAMLFGQARRTAIELEMRIRDGQAFERRIALKRRDDPTDGFLLVIADTRTNRHVLRENPRLFADLPRIRPSVVRRALAAGLHPPTGLVLL
jgi:transcriptional regulator with XRE-family HTH domain